MGILTPLFLAALSALAAPIVFHLVRRAPRGRREFSSLMFLSPSPPRLTRRSRLDQILLLLLRLAVLGLFAFAFARPFLRESALLSAADLPGRRVALLVDVSASMQQEGVWPSAIAQAERELEDLSPQDDVALYLFANQLTAVVPFRSDLERDDVRARGELIRNRLRELQPGWSATDLGSALATIASELTATAELQQAPVDTQIVLISDLQQGTRLDALQAVEWPQRIHVVHRLVRPSQPSNATVHLLPSDPELSDHQPRVRVVNSPNSTHDQFFLRWSTTGQRPDRDEETAVYVPPGESRVVRLPRPERLPRADRILLRGDAQDFDNTTYALPPQRKETSLLYVGEDTAEDERQLLYFLRLATADDPLRSVNLQAVTPESFSTRTGSPAPHAIICSRLPPDGGTADLASYVERGGTLVLVPFDDAATGMLTPFFDDLHAEPADAEAREGRYLLLGEIDFTHPWFVPLGSPRFSDFTKIHFWKRRPVRIDAGGGTRVVARFDNGDPWLLERERGRGRLFGMTSGWQPADSQLAVSSKFVVLMGGLLDQASGGASLPAQVTVDQGVRLPAGDRQAVRVRGPDGREFPGLPLEDESASRGLFRATSVPGIYHATAGNEELDFAVNLHPAESETAPLSIDVLEQLGVRFGEGAGRQDRLRQIRQQREQELENRQKVWRWLLAAGLGVLIVESGWAGRAARQTIVLEGTAS